MAKTTQKILKVVVFVGCMIALCTNHAYAIIQQIGSNFIKEENSTPTDVENSWAKEKINHLLSKKLIQGYPDNTFRPDNNITRAEFVTIVNKVLGVKISAQNTFIDVNEKSWFYGDVSEASATGYISGYTEGRFEPDKHITRQEVAAIISKILEMNMGSDFGKVNSFADANDIASWCKGAFSAVVQGKYLTGYPDQTLKPTRPITRAETVSVLDKVAAELKNHGITFDFKDKSQITGDVTIREAGFTLKNAIIKGDLNVSIGLGNGILELSNVTVEGRTIINGQGDISIIFKNSKIGSTWIDKEIGSVRVVADGTTYVQSVSIKSDGRLEQKNNTKDYKAFGNISIEDCVKKGISVQLAGEIDEVYVKNSGAVVDVQGGNIENVVVASTATDARIQIRDGRVESMNIESKASVSIKEAFITMMEVSEHANGSIIDIPKLPPKSYLTIDGLIPDSISYMKVNSPITVTGEGGIENAIIAANGVSISQMPASYEIGEGINAFIAGKRILGKVTVTPTPLPFPTIGNEQRVWGNKTPSATIAKGQALFEIGKVYISNRQDALIYGLKLLRTGNSVDTDISSVSIWDGTTRLNSQTTFSNNAAEITFIKPLIVKGGSEDKCISIKINVASESTPRGSVEVLLADLKSNTMACGLPIASGTYTFSDTIKGSLSVTEAEDAHSMRNVETNKDVRFQKIKILAKEEDMKINTIIFTKSGSIADTDVTNLKLYNQGKQVGTTVNIVNGTATFTFDSELKVLKGEAVEVELRGDIVSGSKRTLSFDIADVNDIQAIGTKYDGVIVSDHTILLTNSNDFPQWKSPVLIIK